MKLFSTVLALILVFDYAAASEQSARGEAQLKRAFEGKRVTLKIDMPATKNGVNVYPGREQPLNFGDYGAQLKRHGTAIRTGESVMVTKVKVTGKHVEFQLSGGGYGTFGDETSSSVYVPTTAKSKREKRLEEDLKGETDERRKRELKEELDDLRRDRDREDQLNRTLAAEAEESKRTHIEQKALQGGSRFNVHYESEQSAASLTPEALMRALAEYVDFAEKANSPSVR
jgi:hypothetical protein